MDFKKAYYITVGPVMAVSTETWREVVRTLNRDHNRSAHQLASVKLAIRELKDYDTNKISSDLILKKLFIKIK